MEFDGIKINEPEKVLEHKFAYKESDEVIAGVIGGSEFLKKVKRMNKGVEERVVYGVYENKNRGIFTKINDFMIDHSKVSLKDKSYFFHMLAVMVDAGIPVVQAVKSLGGRTKNQRFARILNTIAYNCDHGATLSQAMMRFGDVFDEAEVGIVKSGEATGHLDQMLFKLSGQLESQHTLRMKLWGAAVYPIVVLVALVVVSVVMMTWVFPTLLSLLEEGGIASADLPTSTRILMVIQSAVVNYWWLMLIILFGIYGVFAMYVSTSYGAMQWDYVKLRVPVVGGLLRKIYILRFVSSLGLLIDSGLSVIKSLRIVGNSLKNKLYKAKVQELLNAVKEGQKISANLKDTEFLFSPEVVDMLYVGESSASLGKVSHKVAVQYEKEIDNSLSRLTSLFGPIMILFIGVFVALMALAIMAPIFNLSSIAG